MFDSRRVTLNAIFLSAYRFINPIISLFLITAIARYLRVEGMGEYSIIMTYLSIAAMISLLGLNDFIIREFSKKREQGREYILSVYLIGVLSSIIMTIFLICFILLLNYPGIIKKGTFLASFSLIPTTLIDFSASICTAYERMGLTSLIFLFGNLSKVIISVYFLKIGFGLLSLMTVVVLTQCLTLLLAIILAKTCVKKIDFKINLTYCKKVFDVMPVFILISIVSILYWKIDILLLSKIKKVADVGLYSAAYKIMDICKYLPQSFAIAIFPVISIASDSNNEELKSICKSAIKYLLIIILPIIIFISVFAKDITKILYGNDFLTSSTVLQIVIWTLLPYSSVMILAYVLISYNKQKLELKANIIGLITNIILNTILIPKFGIFGAALATFLSSLIFLIVRYLFIIKNIKIEIVNAEIYKLVLICILLGLFSFIANKFISSLLTFMVSILFYIILLLYLRIINRNTLQNAISLIRKSHFE